MRKLSVFVMLVVLLGIVTSAQATITTEFATYQIVNRLLCQQGIQYQFADAASLEAYLVSYETYLAGDYAVVGYGKQSGFNQQAYAYPAGDAVTNLADLGLYTTNTLGTLIPAINFSPGQVWGLKGVTDGGTFYSQTSLNSDGAVHWKLYCLTPLGFDVGFAAYEDKAANVSDFDYNDLVLKIEPNPTPIPGSLLLLGSGLIGLLGLRRKMVA